MDSLKIKKKAKKRKHFIGKILIIIILVSLTAELMLLYLATPLLKSGIQRLVNKESKGIYNIDFDKISIELTTRSLILSDFKLIPDTVLYNKLKNTQKFKTALYQISFEHLSFKNFQFLRFLESEDFELMSIEINKPVLKILALPDKINTTKYDAVHRDLYSIISPYMRTLIIKNISIKEGYFNLQLKSSNKTGKSVAEKISVNLYNFKLDSTAFITKNKLFYSDSLIFEVDNYSLKLNDGIHRVYAEKTKISLADSFIIIKNAKIYTEQEIEKTTKNKAIYNFNLPEIKLLGIDVYKAWFNNEISINKVEFDSAKIHITVPKIKKETSKQKKQLADYKNIYSLIEGKLSAVDIKEFTFKEASFVLFKGFNIKEPSYRIKNLTLLLTNFQLDSTSYYKKNKILYSENILMYVEDYYMELAKGTHRIEASEFMLSTKKRQIKAHNIKILPINNYPNYKVKMNILIPNLQVNNTDFIRAYNFGILNIDEVRAKNSRLNIVKFYRGKKKKKKKIDIIYDMLSDYLSAVNIEKVYISNGSFDLKRNLDNKKSAFFRGNISLNLRDFTVDANTRKRNDRLFYASEFDIKLKKYSMKSGKDLHVLKIGKLDLSSFNSFLEVEELEYYPKRNENSDSLMKKYKKSNLTYFFVDKLSFTDADIKKAIFKKELNINSINILKPQLFNVKYKNKNLEEQDTTKNINANIKESYRKVFQRMLGGNLNIINVDSLKIDSGYIHFSLLDSAGNNLYNFNNKFSVTADNFKFNKDSIINNDPLLEGNAKIELYNYNTLLPDNIHKLEINKITYNTKDSSMRAERVRVKPQKNNAVELRKKNTYTIFFPEITAENIDTEKFISEKFFLAGKINIPKLEIIITKKDINKNNKNIKKENIKQKIKGFKINNLTINNGIIKILDNKDSIQKINSKAEFSINIDNFCSDTTNINKKFKYDKADISLNNLLFNLPDNMYSITSDSVNYSYIDRKLLFKNFNFQFDSTKNILDYLNKNNKKSVFKINIANGFVTSLNIDDIIFNKKVNIEKVFINNSNINIAKYIDNDNKKKISEIEENIKLKLSSKFKEFKIAEFDYNNVNISSINKKSNKKPFLLEDINGKITDFDIEPSKAKNRSRFLLSEDFSLSFPKYELSTTDSMYDFNLTNINISSLQQRVSVSSVELIPRYGKYLFARKDGFQKSVMHIKDGDLFCEGIDFRRLINKKEIDIKLVELNNIDINIFKDKHLPEDSLRRPLPPWKHINRLKNYIKIDSINFNNINIEYEQNNKKTYKTGILNITGLSGNITNITNDTTLFDTKIYTQINVSGWLQEKAFFKSYFFFPLEYEVNDYVFGGSIETFDFNVFNPFLEKTALVSIKSGVSNKIQFNVNANNEYAEGVLKFNYNDLKIKLIDTTQSSKKFKSLATNTFLASDNPKNRLSKLKEGKIYYEKVKHKSEFNFWIKSLLSGVYSTFGIKSKQMKKRIKLNKSNVKSLKKEQRSEDKKERKENKIIKRVLK